MRTVLLGQFTDEHAQAIAARLDAAGIVWWHKGAGSLVRWLDAASWGTRLFVAADRLDEARTIAQQVLAEEQTG
jgi:hypothetical protein